MDPYQLTQTHWNPVALSALSDRAVADISKALVDAREPLIVTGYSGRNHNTVAALVELVYTVKWIRVLDTAGSDMCFPADHPASLGFRYGIHEGIRTADVILVVDCDVLWINAECHSSLTVKIIHIDIDPLKQQFFSILQKLVTAQTASRPFRSCQNTSKTPNRSPRNSVIMPHAGRPW